MRVLALSLSAREWTVSATVAKLRQHVSTLIFFVILFYFYFLNSTDCKILPVIVCHVCQYLMYNFVKSFTFFFLPKVYHIILQSSFLFVLIFIFDLSV